MKVTQNELAKALNIEVTLVYGFLNTLFAMGFIKKAGTKKCGKGKPSILWEVENEFLVKLPEIKTDEIT